MSDEILEIVKEIKGDVKEVKAMAAANYNRLTAVETVLTGAAGVINGGLLGEVKSLSRDYYSFKVKVIIGLTTLGISVGGGLGIWKLAALLGG